MPAPPAPTNHAPVSSPDSSTSAASLLLLEKLLERVQLYSQRMKPLDGKLPPSRGEFDHKIELKDPSSQPVKLGAIPLNAQERAQLAIDIKELLDAGLIVRSESEWGSPVFYVDKDGGQARRRLSCFESPAEA
jgi:hypothetical protein